MYHDFALANSSDDPDKYFTAARLAASHADNGPMIEDLGLMQKEAKDFAKAMSCFRQARTIYTQRGDLFRVVLEEIDTLIESDQKEKALALERSAARMTSDPTAAALLKKIEDELNPPTPTPFPNPSATP
jgi:tetratricopeptide (TPR) repeat protein